MLLLIVVTGVSVLYFMLLLFVLFHNKRDVREMLVWLYPELRDEGPDEQVRAPS